MCECVYLEMLGIEVRRSHYRELMAETGYFPQNGLVLRENT